MVLNWDHSDVWEDATEGWVDVDKVMWVEKGVVIRETAFALPKGFNDGMVGPKNPPWQSAGIVHLGSDIKMGQSRHEFGNGTWLELWIHQLHSVLQYCRYRSHEEPSPSQYWEDGYHLFYNPESTNW